jgi:two-component system, chemotaxis family, sensor kinase CheA
VLKGWSQPALFLPEFLLNTLDFESTWTRYFLKCSDILSMQNTRKHKIIIVDDEQAIRDAIVDVAEALQIDTKVYSSALEALEDMKNYDIYSMIISDFKMPHMTGIEYCQAVREVSDIPFVILTGFADKQMAIKGLAIGLTEILEKPVDFDTLESIIGKYTALFDKKQTERDNDLKELVAFFCDESKELYADLEETLLRLSENPIDPLVVDVIFRKIHSIKGGASAIPGAEPLTRLSHEFESRLSFIKSKKYQPSEDEIPVYLDAANLSMKLIDALRVSFDEVQSFQPAVDKMIEMIKALPVESTSAVVEVSAVAASPTKGLDDDHNQSFHEEEILIKNSQLDHFMELVGELVILKNYYNALVKDFNDQDINAKLMSRAENFSRSIEKATQALQDHLLEVRKVPLKKIASKLQRISRQASKQLNKKVDLEIQGAELKVDKSIATAIGASLTHMLRNSLDHGLEGSEERIAKGKSGIGKISVDFIENKGAIEVTIADDGRGLNIPKIKQKALEKGLITQLQSSTMSDLQASQLIFMPSFSTADQVTDVSGRGVGMDAALNMVEQLDGSIKIEESSSSGSRFKIRIPFLQTVSVERSLVVLCHEMFVAVPIESVRQIVKRQDVRVNLVDGNLVVTNFDENVPLLGFNQDDGAFVCTAKDLNKDGMILSIRAGHFNFALFVDAVLYQTEAVNQPLIGELEKEPYILGTTILGDDQVAYVLDPEVLYTTLIPPMVSGKAGAKPAAGPMAA